MKRKIVILALLSALLCSCAANTGNSISSDVTSVTSESEPATSESVTSEPESKPVTSESGTAETTVKPVETTTKPAETTVKPAETTTKPVETTTKPVETEKPAPEWTETAASGVKYVNTSCYSRKKAVIGSEAVAQYNVNAKVKITAKTNTGYYKIDTGAFIHSDYLSDSKVTVQTTVTTTTKPAATEKPASVPTATSDPVDEKYYANNPPAIDEAWLSKRYSDYVTVENSYSESGEYVDSNKETNSGFWVNGTLTAGIDFPVGWYLCLGNLSYIPMEDTTFLTRSNGYYVGEVRGRSHYYAKGDKIYCNGLTASGEKVQNLSYLLPISKGYTDAGSVYYKGKKNGVTAIVVVGKNNIITPGTYKIKEVEQYDLTWGFWEAYPYVYSTVFAKTYYDDSIKPSTITLTEGDVIRLNDVELIKVS